MSQPELLIVDDDADNREILSIYLRHHGFTVLQAADGLEAVATARIHRPALILMDITMPRLDGWGAIRLLRLDAATRAIPVVAVTALDGDLETRARQSGFTAYLTKPVHLQDTLAAVRRCLDACARGHSWVAAREVPVAVM